MNNNPNAPVLTPAERAAALVFQAQFMAQQLNAGGQNAPGGGQQDPGVQHAPVGGGQPVPIGGGAGQPPPAPVAPPV
jgi:hypothetical protein